MRKEGPVFLKEALFQEALQQKTLQEKTLQEKTLQETLPQGTPSLLPAKAGAIACFGPLGGILGAEGVERQELGALVAGW